MLKIPDLKIGSNIDVVFENEIMKKKAHFMKALVYDINETEFIISQTSPALNRRFLDRRIMVSFIAGIGNRNLRFGFSARLVELIENYKLASERLVEALVLQQCKKPALVDFRKYFRVTPRLQSDIILSFQDEKVNLIDISLGGAKFTCPLDYSFNSGNRVKSSLLIGHNIFNLDAIVHKVSTPYYFSLNQNFKYVSIEFEHENNQLETVLGKTIIEIERHLLTEGKL